jgi:hypothetical protein
MGLSISLQIDLGFWVRSFACFLSMAPAPSAGGAALEVAFAEAEKGGNAIQI